MAKKYFDAANMKPIPAGGVIIPGKVEAAPVVQEKPLDLNMYLSPHFQLKELIRTSHREIDNTPSKEIIERLTTLATEFLEPIRDQFGPIIVTSGYRCPELNKAIGGSKTSAHMDGCAADFMPFNKQFTSRDVVQWVIGSGLDFDQIIDEYGGKTSNWVHIGMRRPNAGPARKEALLYKDGKYSVFK